MRFLSILLFACAATPAVAQDAPPSSQDQVVIADWRIDPHELVIVATRSPTEINRLPARVDVITRDDIEQQGLTSLAQAIGPDAVQSGGLGQQTSVFLRGANSAHTLALFDGIRVNDASNPNGSFDFGLDNLAALDRVEILRGPASSIYGADAIGGVVNLIPRRGGGTAFGPFGEISGGSFETLTGTAGVVGSINGVDYGVTAEGFTEQGYDLVPKRMSTHTGDPDGADSATITASVRADLGFWAGDALFRRRESRTEFDTFSGGPFFDLRADDPALESQSGQTIWRLGAETNGDLRFRVSGGQVLNDRDETDAGFLDSAAHARQSFADANTRWASGDTVITGGFAFDRDSIATVPQFANALRASEDQKAAYLVAQSRFAGHLDATGSVRVDDYENFGAHTTWALGLVANYAPLRLFASYGTGFKAPSLSERFEISLFNVGNPDLDPERSRSREIGADWRALDALSLGASYYQTRIDDLIEYDFGQLKNINIGRAKIDGAEAYIEERALSWGSLRLTYAYTDAKDAGTGAELARRPRNSWRVNAHVTPMERLGLDLSWTYVGARTDVTYDDGGNFVSGAGRAPSFNVGALAATFDLDTHAQLFARIDNITDETYEQPAAFAGAPRSVIAGVRARF